MGIFTGSPRRSAPIEVMRADLYMSYHPLSGTGSAAVDWVPITSDDGNLRPFLVALLYSRILVAHRQSRTRLFELIDEVSKRNVRSEGEFGFPFPEWGLSVGFGAPRQRIWPWTLVNSPGSLDDPKIYRASLLAFPESGGFGINLRMALGQEKVLAPASVLIAITSFAKSTDQEGRYELAVLLWQINEFYGSQKKVRLGSEPMALAAAMGAIRSGNLRAP